MVVAGVAPRQGGRESRPQGDGAQATGHSKAARYAECKSPNRRRMSTRDDVARWSLESPVS